MFNNYVKKKVNIIFYFTLILFLLFGIYIRTRLYLFKAPLWLDEVMLAQSFIDRNFFEMFLPLDAYQKAPPLFCFFVLIIRKIFGLNELSLRFIPCVFGVISLIAFLFLLKDNIQSKLGILTGFVLFTVSLPLVYFCSEFKPYGCDVLICILLLMTFKYLDFNNIKIKNYILLSFISLFLVLFSFPAIFIIPAIIFAIFIKDKKIYLNCIYIFCGIALAGLFVFLSDLNNYLFLKHYWNNVENGFYIIPSFGFIWNFIVSSCKFYIYDLNTICPVIITIFIIMGLFLFIKEKKEISYIIIFIFFFAIIASITSIYPLKPKLDLFMAPIFILLIAKSFDIPFILNKYNNSKILINIILITCLLFTLNLDVPYLNINESDLIYYNKSSMGRDKSLSDRNKVKEYSLFLLNNYNNNDKILASDEFLFNIKWYKSYYNYPIELNITTIPRIDYSLVDSQTQQFIVENKQNHKLWFFGRNFEYYFRCSNSDIIEKLLKENNINYVKFQNKNLYLIHAE